MALAAGTLWECRATASAGMVNGGGFNPNNANFPTDFTATSAMGNSPVLSSATYTFVAGDVGAWVYVRAGSNWTPGFYKIASVDAGAATVDAAIGHAIQWSNQYRWMPSTVAGCATVASPTSGTCGVDYSQQDAARLTAADLACTTPSTTVTSATGGFTASMPGNLVHITAITGTGALVGWYEIVSVSDGNTAVLDRTPAPTNNASSGTFYVGGALSLNNALEDAWTEQLVPGIAFVCADPDLDTITEGFTLNTGISMALDMTGALPFEFIGYYQLRGDNPTIASGHQPTIAAGANATTFNGDYLNFRDITWTTTTATGLYVGFYANVLSCKITNDSGTANRTALYLYAYSRAYECELVSTNGYASYITHGGSSLWYCYCHDSAEGLRLSTSATACAVCFNLFDSCSGYGIKGVSGTNRCWIINNTVYNCARGFYGDEALRQMVFRNNIFSDCATSGIEWSAASNNNEFDYNNFYNNGTDRVNVPVGPHDVTTDPAFTDAANGNFAIGANLPGFPGEMPGGLSTGHLQMGAVQPAAGSGGGGIAAPERLVQ